jgi:hypothetical protein
VWGVGLEEDTFLSRLAEFNSENVELGC